MTIKRRSLFYSVFLILPTLTLYSLSILTYLLPVQSGEKVSVAVTLLLAQTVNFGTLTAILPENSKNFPMAARFVSVVVLHMAAVCPLAIIGEF